jgi:hypothetical protein
VIRFTAGFEAMKNCFPTDYRAMIVDENPVTWGEHVKFWGIRHMARIYETVEFKHDELLKVTSEDTR